MYTPTTQHPRKTFSLRENNMRMEKHDLYFVAIMSSHNLSDVCFMFMHVSYLIHLIYVRSLFQTSV